MNMKKVFIFGALAALLFAACSDEFLEEQDNNGLVKTRSSNVTDSATGWDCGTEMTDPPSWIFNNSRSSSSYTEGYDMNEYKINVYTHIIRPSDGYMTSEFNKTTVMYAVVTTLNNYFAETGISFNPKGTEYIDSTAFINSAPSNVSQVFCKKASNVLHVYVLSQAPSMGSVAGMAKSIISNSVVLTPVYYKNRVMAHEVGHCLGLYHTHHGTASYESGTAEYVDGSNGSTAGDYITDTPADPGIWSRGVYAGTGTDAHGDYYNPDPLNLMSYSGNEQVFTQKQVDRMKATIKKGMVTAMMTTITKHEIEGPDTLDVTSEYSIYCPTGYSASWEITRTSYYTSGKTETSTNTSTGNTIGIVADISSIVKKQIFNITATVTSPNKNYVRKAKKTVVHYYTGDSIHQSRKLLNLMAHNCLHIPILNMKMDMC